MTIAVVGDRLLRSYINQMGSVLDRASRGAAADVAADIRRLHQIPRQCRLFDRTTSQAKAQFGLAPALLEALVAEGLPHQGQADDLRFDGSDLRYLGLRLGTARADRLAFAFLARSLEQFAHNAWTQLSVRYLPHLPNEGTPLLGTAGFPNGDRREVRLQHDVVAAEVTVTLISRNQPTPPALVKAIAAAPPLEFYSLHPPLQGDAACARQTGLSDCIASAHILAECCRSADYDARVVSGLLAAVPWSIHTHWCEVRVEGDWLPLNPLLIRTLTSFGSLDSRSWPPERFCSPILARFPDESMPLIARHDGTHVVTWFPSSVLRRCEYGDAALVD